MKIASVGIVLGEIGYIFQFKKLTLTEDEYPHFTGSCWFYSLGLFTGNAFFGRYFLTKFLKIKRNIKEKIEIWQKSPH